MLQQWPPVGRFGPSMVKKDHQGSIVVTKKPVILLSFLYESRYLPEIFRVCSSHVSAKLRKMFWPFLNQPASYGPYRPKLWWPLATAIFEIFWNGKNWGGFRPFPVTHWKEIWISWKKRRFEIFQTLGCPYHNDVHVLACHDSKCFLDTIICIQSKKLTRIPSSNVIICGDLTFDIAFVYQLL